jgi:hypothetical protein
MMVMLVVTSLNGSDEREEVTTTVSSVVALAMVLIEALVCWAMASPLATSKPRQRTRQNISPKAVNDLLISFSLVKKTVFCPKKLVSKVAHPIPAGSRLPLRTKATVCDQGREKKIPGGLADFQESQ